MLYFKQVLKFTAICCIIYGILLTNKLSNSNNEVTYHLQSFYFDEIELKQTFVLTGMFKCGMNVVYAKKFRAKISSKNITVDGYVCDKNLFFKNKFIKLEKE